MAAQRGHGAQRLRLEALVHEEMTKVGRVVDSDVRGMGVSIVIPAKNEALNLPHVLGKLPDACEVILVDGCSKDDTISVAQRLRPGIRIIGQTREGKGNALACGFAAATGDLIVMIDADGSNDPDEIPRFIAALKDGADFAKGSRFLPGGGSADISLLRRFGNFWLNKIVNLLYGTRYTDLCYGYNAFRRECLDVMQLNAHQVGDYEPGEMLWGDGFEVETLINVRIAKAGLRVTEVPSFETARHHGVSNLNAFSDGLRVLRTIHVERTGAARRAVVVPEMTTGQDHRMRDKERRLHSVPELPSNSSTLTFSIEELPKTRGPHLARGHHPATRPLAQAPPTRGAAGRGGS